MKPVILILNIGALVFSVLWMVKTNYDYEPIILTITLVAALLGLLFTKDFLTSSNESRIKGDKNTVIQGSKKSKANIGKTNESVIDGRKNEVKQN